MGQDIIIIQARTGSRRYPEKVFSQFSGSPLIEILISRLLRSELKIFLAVPSFETHKFRYLEKRFGVTVYGGSENDVLGRYASVFSMYQNSPPVNIIRVTGDNPFTSCFIMKNCLLSHKEKGADLTWPGNVPYGSGIEVLSAEALKRSAECAEDPYEREHLTQYIYKHKDDFVIHSYSPPPAYRGAEIRLTVDTPEDGKRTEEILTLLRKAGISYEEAEIPDIKKVLNLKS